MPQQRKQRIKTLRGARTLLKMRHPSYKLNPEQLKVKDSLTELNMSDLYDQASRAAAKPVKLSPQQLEGLAAILKKAGFKEKRHRTIE